MNRVGPELLSTLLDEHAAALTLYARQWCDCPEDVVQEAFVLLARQAEPPANVVGWLYRVVRNGAISQSRASGRRQRHEAAAARGNEPWFTPTPDDRLDAETAARALEELPLEQRETIVARLWGGRSLDEIATLTGASTSTVHRWYHAGLSALRERLGETCRNQRTGKPEFPRS